MAEREIAEVVKFIKSKGGRCTIQSLRTRFRRYRAPGSAMVLMIGLERMKLGRCITVINKFKARTITFYLRGHEPAMPVSGTGDDDDDLSTIKENPDRSHPLAQPTNLPPGSAARIELIRQRAELRLPTTLPGDLVLHPGRASSCGW